MSIASLYIASSDTVTSSLRWLLIVLAKNPVYQRVAFEEIECNTNAVGVVQPENCHFLRSLLLETLRMYPVSDSLPHLATSDVKVGKYIIPAGSPVMASYTSVMHDPKNFPEPHKFKPDRFIVDNKFLHEPKVCAFGLGKRNCIGLRLARVELFTFAVGIIRRFYLKPNVVSLEPSKIGALLIPQPMKLIFEPRQII